MTTEPAPLFPGSQRHAVWAHVTPQERGQHLGSIVATLCVGSGLTPRQALQQLLDTPGLFPTDEEWHDGLEEKVARAVRNGLRLYESVVIQLNLRRNQG